MILVTGGTGLVGSHLLYQLCLRDEPLRALYRTDEKRAYVKKIFAYYTADVTTYFSKIEWVQGDITDLPRLDEVFSGVTKIYHCAALVSFDPGDYHLLRKTNIVGTANVVNMALHHKCNKMVYVSSVAAIGKAKDAALATEETPWDQDGDHSVYAITKYGAELEVWRGIQEGLQAVIVNPGVILGSGFWYSGSSSLFRRTYKGISKYTTGSTGFVAVKDVVQVMLLLMQHNVKDERFILVAEHLTFQSFFETIAKSLQVRAPQKEVSRFLLSVAWRLDWIRAKLKGKRRRLTRHLAQSLVTTTTYDNSKVHNWIQFEFTPVQKTIQEVATAFLSDQAE